MKMRTLFPKSTLFLILLSISFLTISCGGGGTGGDSAPASPPSDTTAPSVPGALIANAMSTGQMDLSWNVSTDNTGVAGYRVYRDGTYMLTVTSNSRSDTGLANNQNYCYRVSAVDAAGNESGKSNESCAATHGSWTKQWGSAIGDVAAGITRDSSGNIYVTGATGEAIDGQGFAGDVDVFLTKYDSSGARLWTRLIGTSGEDRGAAVDVDASGNIYVTGYVSGSYAGKTHNGLKDVFLAKYEPDGDPVWYQQWGTSTDNFGHRVKVDGAIVYVTGHTNEAIAGDTGSTIPNIFLSKRSTSDGSESWRILAGTANSADYVEGIAVDSSHNIYLAGSTHDVFSTFGDGNLGNYDVFLARFDPATGAKIWVRQWGSASDDLGHGIAVDDNDNIYVTGSTAGSIGEANAGSDDIFLTKLNTTGAIQWTHLFGTLAIDRAHGITVDDSDNVYLTGLTYGTLGGGANQGQGDIFVMKYDAIAQSTLWTRLLGTSALDVGIGVALDIAGGFVYVTGDTSGNLDGNISAGGADAFLLKYSASGVKQ